jgi:hypothetical protein
MFPLIITCVCIKQEIYVTISEESYLKNLFCQAIYGFANTLCFQFQIEDLQLKYCILGQDSKNKISGSNIAS